jgi:fatty-acyl-CoA synthase
MHASLWDHLAFQARLRPHALAVFGPGGPVDHGALVRDVGGLATELLECCLTRGDMVGIQMGSSYLHLVLLLALDRLSIPSMSFASAEAVQSAAIVRDRLGVTAIVSGDAAPADPPCRWIAMAEQHRPRIAAPDAARLAAVDSPADALVRVIWSSGTTGLARGSPITRTVQMRRLVVRRLTRGLGPRARYLAAVPFSSAPGYAVPLAILSAGGALVLPHPGMDFVDLANALAVTMTSGSPALLAELLGGERKSPHRLPTIEVFWVSGAQVPGKLLQEALSVLTPNLWIGYGTTETDSIATADSAACFADPSIVGAVIPWVDVDVVDAADRPLARGLEGRLRVRSDQTIDGYFRDAAGADRNFRGGWFYPGDLGVLTEQGMLRITGRIEDVITRDGVTLSPLPIEEAIRGLAGVRDVAIFPLTRPGGAQEICAALVLEAGADPAAIRAGAARLGDRAPTQMFQVVSLPRNQAGKVVRRELVAWALSAAAR